LVFQFADHDALFRCPERLQLYSGEIVALVGDNGVGKSSLLKSLAGMQANLSVLPIEVLGREPTLGLYGDELGFLFQRPSRQLFEMTVLEELRFSLKRFGLPLEHADEVMLEMGLTHLRDHSPHTLSYGQQHLIALASISAYKPKVLLLDDPFAGLDDRHTCRVWQQLIALSQQGTAILLTSHRKLPHTPVSRYWSIKNGQLLAELQAEGAVNAG
jgi:energy-coupling factor transport system ATP-binding protein